MELIQTHVNEFVVKAVRLVLANTQLEKAHIFDDDEHRHYLKAELEELQQICITAELPMTKMTVDHILANFSAFDEGTGEQRAVVAQGLTGPLLATYLTKARDRLCDELSLKLFLQIQHNRKTYFEEPLNGWEDIIAKFPDCIRDVEEMNTCFALSRYSASMFHALHVAEWGAIILGDKIDVTDPKKGWRPTARKLKGLVAGGHAQLPATIPISFAFIEQMHREIETMELAWRNKVDHAANYLAILPSTDFTPDVAEHIMQSVKVFMKRLVKEL
jgi:hypothetical protein